jgi:hypothetical protein
MKYERRGHLEKRVVDEGIILKSLFSETRWEVVDGNIIDQDAVQWRDILNTLMNNRVI